MSYIPVRDTFDDCLSPEELDFADKLYDEMQELFSEGNHEDQCNCSGYPDNCVNSYGPWNYSPDAHDAIIYLLAKKMFVI